MALEICLHSVIGMGQARSPLLACALRRVAWLNAAACGCCHISNSSSNNSNSSSSNSKSSSSAAAAALASIAGAGPNSSCSVESIAENSSSSNSSNNVSASSEWPVTSRRPGVFTSSCKVAGRQWVFETGQLARLAHGSCLVTVGGTSVLSTVVVDPVPQPAADGVTLQVEYRERLAATGRLPSRPDRRERLNSDRELLAARLVDRALRPLLPPSFLYGTQVWCQVLAADSEVDPELLAVNGASAALLLAAQVPFTQPVGCVKVGYSRQHGTTLLPPVFDQPEQHLLLTYAGSPQKATAIEATAVQVTNNVFLAAMRWAAQATRPLLQAQEALAAAVHSSSTSSGSSRGPPVTAAAAAAVDGVLQREDITSSQQHYCHQLPPLPLLWPSQKLQATVEQLMDAPLQTLFSQNRYQQQQQQQQQQEDQVSPQAAAAASSGKLDRAAGLTALKQQLLRDLRQMGMLADEQTAGQLTPSAAAGLYSEDDALQAFDLLQSHVMRRILLQDGARIDGRQPDELRQVSCQAGPLPRTVHGSGLFTRGETQSLATATVGHERDVGQVESLFIPAATTGSSSSRLHLHYSFPPYSVCEIGKSTPPNRREVGHGNLARAALVGLMPSEDDFPFVVRVTADTLSSSGSSSMAAVCAGAMALHAAGVPIPALAAGVSVGLVTEHPPQLGAYWQQQQQQGAEMNLDAAACFTETYGRHLTRAPAVVLPRHTADSGPGSPADQQQLQQQQTLDISGNATSSSSSSSSDDELEGNHFISTGSSSSSSSSRGGLSSSYGRALLLTDIQGFEDHHGDMDFKVAGTAKGITAVQLDTKLPGVDLHLLAAALEPAAAACKQLLQHMNAAVAEYEQGLATHDNPQHGSLEIMKELVPRLIGPQGSTLLQIEGTTGAALIVDDTGAVTIYAPTQLQYSQAVAAVQEVEGRGVKAGDVYKVKVLRVVDFGAYVALPNGLPCLLHISELSHSKIREVREVLKEGDEFKVVCKGRDAKGFVKLSLKDLLPAPQGAAGSSSSSSDGSSPAKRGQQ